MKSLHNIAIVSLFVLSTSPVLADDCSLDQSVENIIDCIVVEGAGGTESLSTEMSRPFVADDQQQAKSASANEDNN
jgi:hypothetical protein